jgi:chromosome segregation ATPase
MSSLLTQLGQKTKVELDKKLALAGGTMTGALTLSGAPTASLHAATKAYVDSVSSTASGLQTELDATQAGAGLGANGAYTANGSANYISSVTTLQAADNALDTQLKTVADAVASNDSDISTLQSNVSSNDSDISSLQSDVSTAQSDITTLQSNVSSNDSDISSLQSDVSANTSAISSNDSDISALQTQAGSLASDGNSASFSGDISAANAVFSGNLTVQGTTTSVTHHQHRCY